MSEKPIEAQVIRIPDEFSIILNRGRTHGVKEGMSFVIYIEGENVIDPLTGKNLGKLQIVKARVTVTEAQENFSMAKDIGREPSSVASEAIKAMLGGPVIARKLPVNESEIRPLLDKKDYRIRIGDKAKQIVG